MKNIVLIEDDEQTVFRIQQLLHFKPEFKCLLAANSVEGFWAQIPSRSKVDIFLLDIDLPGQSGVDAIPNLIYRWPKAEVIMYTRLDGCEDLMRSINRGATGYVLKSTSNTELLDQLNILSNGGALLSSKMARYLVSYLNPPAYPGASSEFSPKETQTLRLLSEGNTYAEAGAALGMTENGIRSRIKNIYRKLNVTNRTDAIRTFNNLRAQ